MHGIVVAALQLGHSAARCDALLERPHHGVRVLLVHLSHTLVIQTKATLQRDGTRRVGQIVPRRASRSSLDVSTARRAQWPYCTCWWSRLGSERVKWSIVLIVYTTECLGVQLVAKVRNQRYTVAHVCHIIDKHPRRQSNEALSERDQVVFHRATQMLVNSTLSLRVGHEHVDIWRYSLD